MPDKTPMNREAWLTQFAALSLPLIRKRTGLTMPEGTYQLSCGFPSKGGTRAKNKTIGQCHHAHGTGRKAHQIFIHPELVDSVAVGEVVLHELLHAMLPAGAGHRKPFSQNAKKLGLLPDADDEVSKKRGVVAKPTATFAGTELVERIKEIAEQLGEYPHESLSGYGGPKQGTRLLKVSCPLCGYVIRVTSKWLHEVGAPDCPQCNVTMEEPGEGGPDEFPLIPMERTVLYQVKATAEDRKRAALRKVALTYDPRWFIGMHARGMEIEWRVVDTGPAIDENGMAIFGVQAPRYALATGREDAIALLESLRDGSMTWDDLDVDDNNPRLELAEDADPDYEDDDAEETYDDDPYTEAELEIYEQEVKDREQGRAKAKSRPEQSFEERVAELERIARAA